ncbi:MAG TPA: hypothetical protein VNF06_01775 [Candidatus Aquilonibacter sp.]|nr:hypothetical protein [Candidatus Aquilonibacter sp.]
MAITVYKSPDGRFRSAYYKSDDENAFAIAEKTHNGVLVSEFNEDGELLDQTYRTSVEPLRAIADHLGNFTNEINVAEAQAHIPLRANAQCDDCKGKDIVREFDIVDVKRVANVPIVPIFVCNDCKKRYYSMNPKYLRKLISRNPELFKPEELKEKEADEAAFVKEIQEYMIRIFASKKLAMMKILK